MEKMEDEKKVAKKSKSKSKSPKPKKNKSPKRKSRKDKKKRKGKGSKSKSPKKGKRGKSPKKGKGSKSPKKGKGGKSLRKGKGGKSPKKGKGKKSPKKGKGSKSPKKGKGSKSPKGKSKKKLGKKGKKDVPTSIDEYDEEFEGEDYFDNQRRLYEQELEEAMRQAAAKAKEEEEALLRAEEEARLEAEEKARLKAELETRVRKMKPWLKILEFDEDDLEELASALAAEEEVGEDGDEMLLDVEHLDDFSYTPSFRSSDKDAEAPIDLARRHRLDFDLKVPEPILTKKDISQLLGFFETYDYEHTGFIDTTGVLMIFRAMGYEPELIDLRKAMSSVSGKAKGGKVTFQELVRLMKKKMVEREDLEGLYMGFKALDVDKKKYINAADLYTAAGKLGLVVELEREEALQMLEESDKDRDGVINFKEFCENVNRANIYL